MKFYLTSFLIILSFVLRSQDSSTSTNLTNKKGINILPEAGDFSIGVNATPFLNYAGNIFRLGDVDNQAPVFGFTAQHPGEIYGKYYLAEDKAIRFVLLIGYTSSTDKEVNIIDPTSTNELKMTAISIGASLGIEKNKRKSRLMGLYGVEGGFSFVPYTGLNYLGTEMVSGKVKFNDAFNQINDYKEKGGLTINLFAQGFIGAEYFIAPKFSLGGEFGLGFAFSKQNERKYLPPIGDDIVIDPGYSDINLEIITSGDLILHLYF